MLLVKLKFIVKGCRGEAELLKRVISRRIEMRIYDSYLSEWMVV